jgi:hypothetical protein
MFVLQATMEILVETYRRYEAGASGGKRWFGERGEKKEKKRKREGGGGETEKEKKRKRN